MGAGPSQGKAGSEDGADAEPPPKKVFLKVKVVSAHGLSAHVSDSGFRCVYRLAGKRTSFETQPVTGSTNPEWHHASPSIEDYEAGDALVFEIHEGRKKNRAAAPEDPDGAPAPLGTATLASDEFHQAGFSGEVPLRGDLMAEEVRLRVKVVVGTKRAVREHSTRSQVLSEALKAVQEEGLDKVEELDREAYISQNKVLARELRAALKGDRYAEMKKAYADFRTSVEEARSQPSGSSAPAIPAIVEARAECLLRRLAPTAGVIGCEGAAGLLKRLVVLLPEEPQRHALHQALLSLQKDEQESGSSAEALLAAGEEAAGAEAAAAAAAAAAEAPASGDPPEAPVVIPESPMPESAVPKSRANLLARALQEVEGEKLDEVSSLSKEQIADRSKVLAIGIQSVLPPQRLIAFQGHYTSFEETVRDIRPEEPADEAERKRSAAAATFAGQATEIFGEASETVGEDAAAPLLGQVVQLVPDQPARHALHRELAELQRLESTGAGALALPEEESSAKEAAAESPGFGAGALAAVGAAFAGVGAAAAAWWATSSSGGEAAKPDAAPPPEEPAPAAEAMLPPPPPPTESAVAAPSPPATSEALPPTETLRQGDPGKLRVAQALGSLGTAYRNVGKLEDALRQNKQALNIKKQDLGDEHPDTAVSYNNVAAIYRLQGKLPEAYEHYMKALEIRRRTLGDLSQDTAMSHSNVGAVLLQRGAVDECLEHYSRALEITRAVYGDQHPETAARYNDVGAAFEQKGDLDKALEHLWSALEIQTQTLGDQDPGVGDSYNNVGAVLWQLERLEEALEFHSRALEIRLATLGEGHSDTALSYGNVGVILEQQGRLAEAVEHQRKALHIRSMVLGEQHHETAASHVNVAIALERQGHFKAALDHFRDASRILKATMGNNHPWTKQAALHLQRCEKASRSAR